MEKLDTLRLRIDKFNKDRDWDQFHSPVNLAKSISIESGELLECFQWSNDKFELEDVKEEIADVMNYCLQMCNVLGLDPIDVINKKMDLAANDIRSAIKIYLNEMALELETKILTQRLVYDIEEYKLVSRKLNPEYVGSEHLRSIVPLMEFIKSRQDSKEVIDEDPGVIAGVLRSALLIGSQKGDLQQYNYEKIRELLFEAVTNQITRP